MMICMDNARFEYLRSRSSDVVKAIKTRNYGIGFSNGYLGRHFDHTRNRDMSGYQIQPTAT